MCSLSRGHLLRAKDRVWHHTQKHHSGRTSDKHTCTHDPCMHAEGLHCLLELSQLTSSNAAPPFPSPNNRTSLLLILQRGRERERDLDFRGEGIFSDEKKICLREFVSTRGKLERIYRDKYRSVFSKNVKLSVGNLLEKVEWFLRDDVFLIALRLKEL